MTTLDELLARVEELDKGATRRPWKKAPLALRYQAGHPDIAGLEKPVHAVISGSQWITTAAEKNAEYIAFSRDALPALAKALRVVMELARNCADNFDCDADSHLHNVYCRACEAARTRAAIESILAEVVK